MQLVKQTPAMWNGTGFGNSKASWAIKGHEHWKVWATSAGWAGHNTQTNAFVCGLTRETLLSKIENML